jgi:hypothetical protein
MLLMIFNYKVHGEILISLTVAALIGHPMNKQALHIADLRRMTPAVCGSKGK